MPHKKTGDLISDNLETEHIKINKTRDCGVMPRNFFPTHATANEAHLAKVYGS